MLIGCCLNMHAEGGDATGASRIDEAAKAGYDYIELPVTEMMALDAGKRQMMLSKVRDSGVPCVSGNNLFPPLLKLLEPATKLLEIFEYLKKAVSFMRELGAQKIVFGSGSARMRPKGMTLEEGHNRLEALLHGMSEIACEAGLVFVLETLRAQESNILNTMGETHMLCTRVASPHIRMLCDNFHMGHAGETIEDDLLPLLDQIHHAHFCRFDGRVIPTGALRNDEVTYLQALVSPAYNKTVSIEAYSGNFVGDSTDFLKELRKNRW